MGKSRTSHSGVHNGVHSRKGRRGMSTDDLQTQVALFGMRVVAYKSDLARAEEAWISTNDARYYTATKSARQECILAGSRLILIQAELARREVVRLRRAKLKRVEAAKIMKPLMSPQAHTDLLIEYLTDKPKGE